MTRLNSHHVFVARGAAVALSLTIGVLVLALAGCSTPTPPRASSGSGGPVTGGGSATQSDSSYAEWALSFARCIRAAGLTLADPPPGGQLVFDLGASDSAAFKAADAACTKKLGNAPAHSAPGGGLLSGEQLTAAELAAAKCLRDHGYNVVDPKPGHGLSVPQGVSADVTQTCLTDGLLLESSPVG